MQTRRPTIPTHATKWPIRHATTAAQREATDRLQNAQPDPLGAAGKSYCSEQDYALPRILGGAP